MDGNRTKFGVVAALSLAVALGSGAAAAESAQAFMKAVNTDADQTISLQEVDAFAMKRFDALNTNKDETLSSQEIGGRMNPAEFRAADTKARAGQEPTLSREEFKAYVDKLFVEANITVKAPNTRATGTLSAKELATPAGMKLIRLLE